MADRITYIGLDVHKEGIVVAVAAERIRRTLIALRVPRPWKFLIMPCTSSSAAKPVVAERPLDLALGLGAVGAARTR